MRLKGFLFDMDGILLDTERTAYRLAGEITREMGYELNPEAFYACMGVPRRENLRVLREHTDPGFPAEELLERLYHRLSTVLSTEGAPVKTGVREILDDLKNREIPCAVATSTDWAEAEALLTGSGLRSYFACVIGGDMIANGKPAPDIYLEAARRIGLGPEQTVAFEDSVTGLKAAAASGSRAVMIPDLQPATEQCHQLAFLVIPSMTEAHRQLEYLLS